MVGLGVAVVALVGLAAAVGVWRRRRAEAEVGAEAVREQGKTPPRQVEPRLERLFTAVDALNEQDPRVGEDGAPQELVYGKRMTLVLDEFDANAPDVVRVACRAQHVARWRIPRSDFPEGRAGYLAWRKTLQKMHAQVAGELMAQVGGFSDQEKEAVRHILCKEDIKGDPLTQCLEDVAALVFLQFYFDDFAAEQDRAKMVNILRKTWVKMSDRGHEAALKLTLPPSRLELVKEALSGKSASGGGDD